MFEHVRCLLAIMKIRVYKSRRHKGSEKSTFREKIFSSLISISRKIYLYNKSSRFSRLEFRRFLFDDLKRDLCFSLIGEIDPDLNENKPSN